MAYGAGTGRPWGIGRPAMDFSAARLLGLLVICAAVGLLAGVRPAYGIGAALGLAFVAIVVSDAMIGLLLFTVLSFLGVLQSGGAADNLMKVVGLLLFSSWIASVATGRAARDSRSLVQSSPKVVISAVALLAWSAISIVWASDTGVVMGDTLRYALNMLLIPVVFGIVRDRRQVLWFVGAFILGATISSMYGLLVPAASTAYQAGQLTGGVGDANEEAAVLVGAVALSFGLIESLRDAPRLRLLAIAAVAICLAGTINTLSRSGLIALVAMVLASVVFGGEWRRWGVLLLILTVVGGFAYYATAISSSTRSRITSSDTSGRSTIWRVGWRMVEAHPFIGVGSGNFQTASIHYLQAPGLLTRADLVVDTPKVAHNIYLEVLADLGIPGLLAFLGVVFGCAGAAWEAAKRFHASGDRELELMSRSVILAIVGFMTSDFFLSGEFSKQLWLVFALGPTLLGLARRQDRPDLAVLDFDPEPELALPVPARA